MKRRIAYALRRIAHRLHPELLDSLTVAERTPEGWRHIGQAPPERERVTHVDIRFTNGRRIVGYVDHKELADA